MNGKKSLTRSRKFRDRVTAVVASAGAIALTAGFMMMAVAGPANADKGGNPNEHANSNAHGNSDKGKANGQGKDNGKKTDVCRATSSMTNPYVFINVSVNAVSHGKGHYMHKYAPNKTWKDAAWWNGTSYAAGDPRPDFIEWDGDVFTEEWCEAAPTGPPVDEPTEPPGVTEDVCPNLAGNQAEVPDGMDKVNGECAEPPLGTETTAPKPDKKPTVKGTEAVPTAVDAGIGGSGPTMTGTSPIDLLAQMLVGGGLALLMAAGWMQIGRRPNGIHQA